MRSSAVPGLIIRRFLATSSNPCCFAAAPPPPPPPPPTTAGIPLEGRRQQEGKGRSVFWWLAVSAGVGTTVGLGLGYDKVRKMKTLVANQSEDFTKELLLAQVPEHRPSRSIVFPTDTSGLKLTLFQYQTCPFCCKVRAMLDYFGLSYDIVEVNPVLRSQIKWSTTYKKVPILVVQTPQGEVLQLNDSSMIVSALYSYLVSHKANSSSSASQDDPSSLYNIAKCYPPMRYNDDKGQPQQEIMNRYFLMLDSDTDLSQQKTKEIMEERKWRRWADSVYVHTLSPNIYRTFPEAIESFKNFDKVGEWEKNFATWERYLVIYVGALAMWIIGKRLQKRHNLKANVRQSLWEESDVLMKEVKSKGGRFLGGDKPNLGDLAVFGVLNSIDGCRAFEELMEEKRDLREWYEGITSFLRENRQEVAMA